MKTFTNPTARFAAVSAAVAAVASAVGAAIQVTHDFPDTRVVGFVEHLSLAMFSVLLVAMIAPVAHLAQRAIKDQRPVQIMGISAVALAILGTISNVKGDDPSFFPFVAAPTNLAIMGSFIAIAIKGRKSAVAPKWLVVGLPFVQIVSIPLSQFGGGFLAAAYWLALAAWAVRAERPVSLRGAAPTVAA